MKKKIVFICVLAMIGLISTCLPRETRSTQARAASQGFGSWETNFGLVLGQKARITVANRSAERIAEPLGFQCSIFDENGAMVFETSRLEVPPREFRRQDIDWENLVAVDGEPVTLRKSVLVKVIVTGFQSNGSRSPEVLGSLEIIDAATGKTTASSYSPPIFLGPMVGDFN